jgi:hypothetical protein
MNYEVTGKLVWIGETQQIKESFKKREFALELLDGQYTNYAALQLVQAKCELIDAYKEGDMITASFNVRGTRYEKDGNVRYFSNLDAWRLQPANGGQSGGGNQQGYNNAPNFNQNPTSGNYTPQQGQGGGFSNNNSGGFNSPQQGGYGNPQTGGGFGQDDVKDDLPF